MRISRPLTMPYVIAPGANLRDFGAHPSQSEQQSKLFEGFDRIAGILHPEELDEEERNEKINALFGVKEDTALLVEIMDIQDELNIIMTVLTQQKEVLDQLAKLYPKSSRDDDESRSLNNDEELLKKLRTLFSNRVEARHIQVNSRSTQTENAPTDGQRYDEPDPSEDGSHQQPKGRDNESEFSQEDGPRLEDTVSDQGGAERQEPAQEVAMRQCKATVTDKPSTDGHTLANSHEQSILRNRDLLQESIDIVDGNIKSVNHMLKHASKVQEEVRMQRC